MKDKHKYIQSLEQPLKYIDTHIQSYAQKLNKLKRNTKKYSNIIKEDRKVKIEKQKLGEQKKIIE